MWKTDSAINAYVQYLKTRKEPSGWVQVWEMYVYLMVSSSLSLTMRGRLFSDVLFIIGDQEDNIWFGGKYGIWKYDGEILTEIATNE